MARSAKPRPRAVIYTGDNCPYCRQLKQYLQQHGVRFQERNIERSRPAALEYQRLRLRGVPVLVVGKSVIPGFQPGRIAKLLGIPS
jgi:glutaredoxin-like protein NrdH